MLARRAVKSTQDFFLKFFAVGDSMFCVRAMCSFVPRDVAKLLCLVLIPNASGSARRRFCHAAMVLPCLLDVHEAQPLMADSVSTAEIFGA